MTIDRFGGAESFHPARTLLLVLLLAGVAGPLAAQDEYGNTGAGHPVLTEDAYPVDRYALEVRLPPFRLEEWDRGGRAWGVEPSVAYGLLPRTQVTVRIPVQRVEGVGAAADAASGVAGVGLSALHNLSVETAGRPALAVQADMLLPVGSLGPARVHPSLSALATRTFRLGRVHLNGRYTFGTRMDGDGEVATPESFVRRASLSRWGAGAALDRRSPLSALLWTAEVVARQPMEAAAAVDWSTGLGARYQQGTHVVLEAGVDRRLNGPLRGWTVRVGAAYALALRSLIPPAGIR
jgi:hypothetical protein